MCFRPATAEARPNKCLKCQTVNEADAGVCANCGATLLKMPPPPGAGGGLAPGAAAPKAPSAPTAPKAPSAPSAPGV